MWLPGCQHVNAPTEDLVSDFARNPKARCGVFSVRDDQVDTVPLDEGADATPDQFAAGPADNVANEEQSNHWERRQGRICGPG